MKRKFCISAGLLLAFLLWTILVCFVDVGTIGPNGSSVGLAAINGWFHQLIGVHMVLYHITDWLGLVPVAVGFGFAILGLAQWIKRKSILKVDFDILVLGGFYILTLAGYLLFEEFVINYRPVLINGYLEASYPSSTTLLVLCVMPTAKLLLRKRGCHRIWQYLIDGFILFMVVGRLISGVHWLTDIIGGILLSATLVMLYRSICDL